MNICADWLSLADDDLASAAFLADNMYPVPAHIVCFHCQQAGEKYLKGYLTTKMTDEPPYIHDLEKLNDLCKSYDPSFAALQDEAALLTSFAAITRYDRSLSVDESEMKLGLMYAETIKKFVAEKVKEALKP